MARSSFIRMAVRTLPQPATPSGKILSRGISALCFHVYTVYLFSRDNIKDIICMGFLFGALNASAASRISLGPPISFTGILASSPAMLLWSWSNLFLFNLHNQRHASAVAEDAVNKPWRPIPAGRLSSREATLAMYFMYLVILAICLEVGGLLPCIFEVFLFLWYNEWGGASDPYLKNILNGLGFACFFAGPLEVATGHSVLSSNQQTVQWLLLLVGAITTTANTQDFRDMEEDRASGRKTVPLLIGDLNARLALAAGVAGWTGLACWFWGVGLAEWRVGSLSWIAGTIMAGKFSRDRTRAGDSLSWKLFPAWPFCATHAAQWQFRRVLVFLQPTACDRAPARTSVELFQVYFWNLYFRMEPGIRRSQRSRALNPEFREGKSKIGCQGRL